MLRSIFIAYIRCSTTLIFILMIRIVNAMVNVGRICYYAHAQCTLV